MSKPKERSWNNLQRLGRYLQANPRYVQEFKRQGKQTHATTWVDTDYAGCLRTRKSTSGGLINIGTHLVKSWSATQKPIALSSGEAEYYGVVRGAATSKGTQPILKDMGIKLELEVLTDSSAAKRDSHQKMTGSG